MVDSSFVLSHFSDIRARAIRDYVRFVENQIFVGHREDLYRVRDQRFLGDEDFVERVARGRSDGPFYTYDLPIQELVAHVSSVLDISVEIICGMSRNREGAWGRAVVGYMGKRLCGYLNKSFAQYFHRDPVAVSRGIAKVEEKIRSDKAFEITLQRLEEEVVRGARRKISY